MKVAIVELNMLIEYVEKEEAKNNGKDQWN